MAIAGMLPAMGSFALIVEKGTDRGLPMDSEAEHLLNIDAYIRRAEGLLALAHVDVEDEENYNDEYERIYHCEVCLVREVLETVWPSIEQYVDWLKSQIPDKSKLNEG